MIIERPECGGSGYDICMDHHPMCDGTCSMCPIPVQVPCECCGGVGEIEIEEEADQC